MMVAIPDLINGLFEFIGALAIFYNCVILYRHKEARGISLTSSFFFISWGAWNCFYYPHLDQLWSFLGAVLMLLAQCTWLVLWGYLSLWPNWRGIGLQIRAWKFESSKRLPPS